MTNQARSFRIPPRDIPVAASVDILVVGGGMAGVGAAVSAARGGAKVLLAEPQGFLGGTMTAVTVGSICGEFVLDEGRPRRIVGGLMQEVSEALARMGGSTGPECWLETATTPYDPFLLRVALDRLAMDAGIALSFHTRLLDIACDEGAAQTAILLGPGGPFALEARQFIDCTGDAVLAAAAGVAMQSEPAQRQMPSAMFRFGGVAADALERLDRPALRTCLETAVVSGVDLPRTAGGLFSIRPGMVHANVTRVEIDGAPPDPFSAAQMTAAEIEGRRQILLYTSAFCAHVPGFERAYVADAGSQLGIRESRRIAGAYCLQGADVLAGRHFDDGILNSAWPVEEHGADRKTRWVWLKPGDYYQLPLRCLVPASGPRNLLVAGRCASASHEAHASMRVGATCMAMGQAAGVTAALALDTAGGAVARIPASGVRDRLRTANAILD